MSDLNGGGDGGEGVEVVKRFKCSGEMENVGEEGDKEGAQLEEDLEGALSPPKFVDQYHVVKHILEYLKMSDLLRAGIVNRQWAEIGRNVRKQRKSYPYAVLVHPYLPQHKLAFEYFNDYKEASEEAKQLVESGKEGYHPYKQRGYHRQKFTGLLENAREVIRRSVVQEAFSEPQIIVNFGTTAFDTHLVDEHEANFKRVSKERCKIILGGIQDSVSCLTSFSCGVVATVPECNKALEMEKGKFPCLSSMAIPKVPGLKIKTFTVTKEQNRVLKGNENVESCKKFLGIQDEDNNEGLQLKGIMLLHKVSHRTSSVVLAILQFLKAHPHIALAGGVHESVLMSGVPDDSIVAAGLLIYGSDLVRVSSVALHDTRISKTNSGKLEKLKSSILPGESSLAFMFACNGRGRHMHGRPNVESDLFNSLFPTTPLVGAFTLGEYCNETRMEDLDGSKNVGDRPPPKRIDFAYTTVFLLISYRHPPELQREASS